MSGISTTQRLLVLVGANSRQDALVDLLKSQHDVIVAHSIEAALTELRAGEIDAVFSDAADFLPLERAIASQQSGLILDTIGEGICITDEDGQILWANRRMKQWSEPIRDRIRAVCHEAWGMFVNQMSPLTDQSASLTLPHSPNRSRK